MADIKGREDLTIIVDSFYNTVKTDETLGYIFDDIMHINWDTHLPKMYDF